MILVKPSFEILEIMGHYECADDYTPLSIIERAGRTCYKSEDKIDKGTDERFVKMVLKNGHESVIEHSAMTVKLICDRGVTHELVRHRLAAYSQESTRYCNYKGGVTFVIPPWVDILPGEHLVHCYADDPITTQDWMTSMFRAESTYIDLLNNGWSPQQARSVLPNSLKTEIVVTTNFREWRHIFKLRCAEKAHPQMREVMIPLRDRCKELIPIIFDDLT